jgi:hypothetical protein
MAASTFTVGGFAAMIRPRPRQQWGHMTSCRGGGSVIPVSAPVLASACTGNPACGQMQRNQYFPGKQWALQDDLGFL